MLGLRKQSQKSLGPVRLRVAGDLPQKYLSLYAYEDEGRPVSNRMKAAEEATGNRSLALNEQGGASPRLGFFFSS